MNKNKKYIIKKRKIKNKWLIQHINDTYVQKAKKNNIYSRSWFKIEEIQKKTKLLTMEQQ